MLRDQMEALRMQTEIWKSLATNAAERAHNQGQQAPSPAGTIPDLLGSSAPVNVPGATLPPIAAIPVIADAPDALDLDAPLPARPTEAMRDLARIFLGPNVNVGQMATWGSLTRQFGALPHDHMMRLLTSVQAPPGFDVRSDQVAYTLRWIVTHAR